MHPQIRLHLQRLPPSQLPQIVKQASLIHKSYYGNAIFCNSLSNKCSSFSTKRSPKTKRFPNKNQKINTDKERSNFIDIKKTVLSPLEQIKSDGLRQFENMTDEVVSKSRKLLTDDKLVNGEDVLTIAQLRKAEHVERTLTKNIDKISRYESIFNVGGEPIVIVDVEVSVDLRYARVIWSLPFEIENIIQNSAFSSEEKNSKKDKIVSKMQNILETNGRVRLQDLINISAKGRAPKLRFVHENAAKNRMNKISDFLNDENLDPELLKYL